MEYANVAIGWLNQHIYNKLLIQKNIYYFNIVIFCCCFFSKFVEFDNVISAEDAYEQFNDQKLDFVQIKVRLSEQTKNELKLKKKEPSILLERFK